MMVQRCWTNRVHSLFWPDFDWPFDRLILTKNLQLPLAVVVLKKKREKLLKKGCELALKKGKQYRTKG